MEEKEYIELFKIWFPTKTRMKPDITPENFAKEYHGFKMRFEKEYWELGSQEFVGSIEC